CSAGCRTVPCGPARWRSRTPSRAASTRRRGWRRARRCSSTTTAADGSSATSTRTAPCAGTWRRTPTRCRCRWATAPTRRTRTPAAAEDALTAYEYAVENAADLGAGEAVAVGGDSAGGNLAAVVGIMADPAPDFALLIYPAVDLSTRRRSRDLFAEGFYLTDDDMTWFSDHYCPPERRGEPMASPLLAGDLSGFPPTYLVTAGFDPLRDEGEEFAKRLEEAGVPVALRRQQDLIHAFANMW